MIEKYFSRNPLSLDERIRIKEAIDLNLSYREIGEYVGRCKSVVMREAKRLGHYSLYDPAKAQQDFETKIKNKRKSNGMV